MILHAKKFKSLKGAARSSKKAASKSQSLQDSTVVDPVLYARNDEKTDVLFSHFLTLSYLQFI